MSQHHGKAGDYRQRMIEDPLMPMVCAYKHKVDEWGPCSGPVRSWDDLQSDHYIPLADAPWQKAEDAWVVPACPNHNRKAADEAAARRRARTGGPMAETAPRLPRTGGSGKKTGATAAPAKKKDDGWSPGWTTAGVILAVVAAGSWLNAWPVVMDTVGPWIPLAVTLAVLCAVAWAAWKVRGWLRVREAAKRAEALQRFREGCALHLPGTVPGSIEVTPLRGGWHARGVLVRARVGYPMAVKDTEPALRAQFEKWLREKIGDPLGITLRIVWDIPGNWVEFEPGEPLPAAPTPEAPAPEAEQHEVIRENLADSLREQFKDKAIEVTIVKTAADHSPTSIRIFYGKKFPDAKDTSRQEFLAAVAAKTDERWRPTWDRPRNVVLLARRAEMPPVVPNRIPDLWESGEAFQFPLGLGERTDLLYWDIYDAPHALVAGGTGGGKTVTLHALVWWASLMGWEIVLVDPKGTGLGGLRGLPGVVTAALADPETMNTVLTGNAVDMRARYGAVLNDGVPFTRFARRLLVVDEYAELISLLKSWHSGLGEKGEPTGIEALRSVPRLGREANVLQVTGVHQANGRIFQGTEVRELYGLRVGMGPQGEESAKMLFDRVDAGRDIPQTAKGRATYALKQGEPQEMQTFWTPTLMPNGTVKPRRNEDREPHPDDVALIERLWDAARAAQARRERARGQAAVEAMNAPRDGDPTTAPVDRPTATLAVEPPRQRPTRPETAILAYLNTCAMLGDPQWVISDGEAVQVIAVGDERDDDDYVEVTFRDAKRVERTEWMSDDTVFELADRPKQ